MYLKYQLQDFPSKTANGKTLIVLFKAAKQFSRDSQFCKLINFIIFSNAFLAQKGFPAPTATKTGTTIVGIIYADGVILGADTRATENTVVSDKNCQKIHYLAGNMYCCGAGTAADTEMTTQTVASQLELQRLHTGRTVPVETAATLLKRMLFRYQGYIGAALVLGGVDRTGPHIYCIYPHGSVDKLPYATMGKYYIVPFEYCFF